MAPADFDRDRPRGEAEYAPPGRWAGQGWEMVRREYAGPGAMRPVTWGYTEAWMVPGPYTGRGPRGYRRSDERIWEDVCERLTQHGQLDASGIEVRVENGEVTLEGIVSSREAKRMAEDTAESVPGVRDVHNRLRIGRLEPAPAELAGQPQVLRSQIRVGMDVLGSDGERIGEVKELRDNDFVVDRHLATDIYVPFEVVQTIRANQVVINVPAAQVDTYGWAKMGTIITSPGTGAT